MKKRLLKAMPHIPILELRPELKERNELTDDPDERQDNVDDVDSIAEATHEENTTEMEANTTFHDLRAEHTGGNNGLIQRVKRFISKRKVNGGHGPAGRIRCVTNEIDNMRYGDDESSESDNALDQHDGIPLLPRNKRT